jgi:hypothetical protein
MQMIGDRLPRGVGYAVNAALSLVMWRGILAGVMALHWGSLLAN